MLRRLALSCTLLVFGGLAAAAPASAHVPFGAPQFGCITESDAFSGPEIAAAARNNTCGSKSLSGRP